LVDADASVLRKPAQASVEIAGLDGTRTAFVEISLQLHIPEDTSGLVSAWITVPVENVTILGEGELRVRAIFGESLGIKHNWRIVDGDAPKRFGASTVAGSAVLGPEKPFDIANSLAEAHSNLMVVDPYVDPSNAASMLSKVRENVSIRLLTGPEQRKNYAVELPELRARYPKLEVRYTEDIHDRLSYLIAFGFSLKDLDRRVSFFFQVDRCGQSYGGRGRVRERLVCDRPRKLSARPHAM
jgi:hypothetical protein